MISIDVDSPDYAWLGLSKEDVRGAKNPLLNPPDWVTSDNHHLYIVSLLKDPKNFAWTCKVLFGIELIPHQVVVLQELWYRSFPMFIASRGAGKSFLLGIYCLLKSLLVPESKIVIVGAAYRQAKVIFEYCESIWHKAPIYRSLCSDSSGPRRDIDRCVFKINNSVITALPLGDGGKIRGLRAHTIIADEFNCTRSCLVETDLGLCRIEDLVKRGDFQVVNLNGDYESPENNIITPPTDVYEVKTEYGYTIECSKNHLVLTQNGWKKTLDLIPDEDYIISDNKYIFPEKQVDIVDKDLAWLMGVLVSEGTLTNKNYIGITTTDEDFKNRCIKNFNRIGKDNIKVYEVESYKDKRGWVSKKKYDIRLHDTEFREKLLSLGLDYVTAHDKKIPWSILQSPRSVVASFLSGLFEGDGSCFTFKYKNQEKRLACSYYTVSESLARELQTLLLKYDIVSQRQTRKSNLSKKKQWMIRTNGEFALNLINILDIDKWNKLASVSYVFYKKNTYGTSYLKDRNKYRASIKHNGKNVYLGQFSTESDAISAVRNFTTKNPRGFKVKCVTKLKDQGVLYDFYLPKTHSFYGNGMVQHNSIPVEIYETVIVGFAAVSKDPVSNVKEAAKRKRLKLEGSWSQKDEDVYSSRQKNQSILSGTAGYDFEPFADYWRKYKSAIRGRGYDEDTENDEENDYMKHLNPNSFSIVRLPYELIPEGFMSDEQIARSRATMHSGTYMSEYGACFPKDSKGFFKRSVIEAAVAKEKNIKGEMWPVWCSAPFDAVSRGDSNKSYVMGIDPASEVDNFAIVILENYNDHRRIVYSWTTNKKDFNSRKKIGLTVESDYYSFCVRKIRDLYNLFPCTSIVIDSQGGGYQIAEGLRDKHKMNPGEKLILPIIEDKQKDTDVVDGAHIIHLVQFSNADWLSQANHGLRKDLEDKVLLFPQLDALSLAIVSEQDKVMYDMIKKKVGNDSEVRIYDSLEDNIMNIEELKNELSSIIVSRTPNGRERFDTPEIKLGTGKKGKMRKDRYSALLIGNMIARTYMHEVPALDYNVIGRSRNTGISNIDNKQMYVGWGNVNTSAFRVVGKS
jgi:intein/homing endonuclease